MSDDETYKKGFDAWENATAAYFERWMKSPFMLGPMGLVLSQAMKARSMHDRLMSAWWSAMGLPTKRDQERALCALHKLESRLMDLEEKLEEIQTTKLAGSTKPARPTREGE